MPESFQRLIVQIDVSDLDFALVERVGIHREPVVVRRDLDLVGHSVQYWMVRAAVTELEFVRFAAQRTAPESDGPGRFRKSALFPISFRTCAPGPSSGSGSPGPFERNTPSGLQRQHVFGRGGRRHNRHARARLHQLAARCFA